LIFSLFLPFNYPSFRNNLISTLTLAYFHIYIMSDAKQAAKDCVSGTIGGFLQVFVGQVLVLLFLFSE
jgi:hypothetical protein